MSTVHFVGGEKGGVGKSVVARVLSQYFLDREITFVAVDADVSHGALLRYYSDYTRGADLENFASADQIMDRALGADRRVLVDLPAQSARLLQRWMEAGDVVSFAQEMQVPLTFWHVSDGGFDSVNELTRVYETFGNDLRYVVVKNFGRSPDFSQLEESDVFKRMKEADAQSFELPALDSATMYKVDRFGSSFWAAVNCEQGDYALTPMERRRSERWLKQCYSGLEQLTALL